MKVLQLLAEYIRSFSAPLVLLTYCLNTPTTSILSFGTSDICGASTLLTKAQSLINIRHKALYNLSVNPHSILRKVIILSVTYLISSH